MKITSMSFMSFIESQRERAIIIQRPGGRRIELVRAASGGLSLGFFDSEIFDSEEKPDREGSVTSLSAEEAVALRSLLG